MTPSLVFRIITLVAVIVSGILFFRIRDRKEKIEVNLTQSRTALQEKLEENGSLKSRVLNAEEKSERQSQLAEEEQIKATGYREQFESLKAKIAEAEDARQHSENEVTRLSAANRDLQRTILNLQASVPPQNWREQLNKLQSRLLELEAENTSLQKSLSSLSQPGDAPIGNPAISDPVPSPLTSRAGEVIRIGPDGSFVILGFGRQMGAAVGQTLSIWRAQQRVGLVSLTQITNDFSIAQILSSSNTGENLSMPDIQIGDSAHLE